MKMLNDSFLLFENMCLDQPNSLSRLFYKLMYLRESEGPYQEKLSLLSSSKQVLQEHQLSISDHRSGQELFYLPEFQETM
jgi:hypothetical protein